MNRILTFLLCLLAASASAQTPSENSEIKRGSFGFGIGLNYGGIGANLALHADEAVSFFGAVGYNFVGTGFNGGLRFLLVPANRVSPHITAMYGYNAVIVVDGASQYDKIYYGPSFGFGIHIKSRNNSGNFTEIEIFAPLRSKEFKDDFDDLRNNPSIEIGKPLPITFSIGYHFRF